MSIFALLNRQSVTIMKKFLFSTFLFLFSFLLTFAAPVDEQSARKIASDFIRSKMPQVTRAASDDLVRVVTGIEDGEETAVYVFNADNSFVIISADDQTPSVLGYSDNGTYDEALAPAGLKAMLASYQKAIRNNKFVTRAEVIKHNAINKLLKTKWDQEGPYNLSCPKDTKTGETSVTGCIATAMAQIMYYHRWPATYDWDKMKTSYETNDSTESAYEVAKLIADVGQSVYMDYSSDGSAARTYQACEALRYNFGYALSTEYVFRENYTVEEWDRVIYNNLVALKPVMYAGTAVDISASGEGVLAGHAFIVDGCDAEGLYHVNWGWGGVSNGYFLLAQLNPDNQGAGGTSGSQGYGIQQEAIVGIGPSDTTNESVIRLTASNFTVEGKTLLSRNKTSVDFPKLKVKCALYNLTLPNEDRKYDIGFALFQGDTMKNVLSTENPLDFKAEYGYYEVADLSIGKDLADGNYQIRPIARETGKTDWVLPILGIDCYAEIIIEGLTMNVIAHGQTNVGDSSFDLNSKEVSTDNRVGIPITFTLNLTDKNKIGNSPVFLWGNEDETKTVLLAGVGSNLDPGSTGDVSIQYIPQREGAYKFYFSASASNYKDAIDSIEVTVAAKVEFDLVADVALAVDNADNSRNITGTSIKGKAKITNNSTETYYDIVLIALMEEQGNNNFKSADYSLQTIEIKVGEAVDVPFFFEDLDTDRRYAISVYMRDKDDLKWVNAYVQDGKQYINSNSVYYLVSDTGINTVQQELPDADVFDLHGVRLGRTADLKHLPRGIYIVNKKKVINK